MNKGELLKPYEDKIQNYIEENPHVVMLNQPYKVTVKTATGKYYKEALIGEEHFEITSCYVGKKGSLIFIFKLVDENNGRPLAAEYTSMEMKADEAYKYLDGFRDYVTAAVESDVVKDHEDDLKVEEEKKAVEEIKKSRETYGEEYGSW